MGRPSFLGIGAQRSGTTWLYAQLLGHPQVFVPTRRKELHYFDWNHDRGAGWYERWFPSPEELARGGYRASGEITPEYLLDESAPARIAGALPEVRLIAMLRDPVDRAFSQYCFRVQRFGERRTFERFYAERPDARRRGQYAARLAEYRRYFPSERFLVLVAESAFSRPQQAVRELARFLSVDESGFDLPTLERRVHSAASRMRLAPLVPALRRGGKLLEALQLDRLKNAARGPLLRWLTTDRRIRPPSPETRRRLWSDFEADAEALAGEWGLDVGHWGPTRLPRPVSRPSVDPK